MNNEVSQQKKDSVLKILAIAGFIGIIILLAWASVRLVSIAPSAFSSLASLAESVTEYQEVALEEQTDGKINVSSNTTLVNAGETVDLSWDTARVSGSYTFLYQCAAGVALDIVETDGNRSLTCGTNYNIGNTDGITIAIDSEKERYADVVYTVAFLGTNDTEPRASGTASLTIINSEIQNFLGTNNPLEETVSENTEEVSVNTNPEEVTATETVPETETNTAPETGVYEQEFVYTIPTSDPNGRTDLATKFIQTGAIVGNTFFADSIMQGEDGALQFEVKNYGSKTSDEWSYTVSLPNGSTYKGEDQTPLKPNERAVITIGFPATDKATHTFVVTIDEPTDSNTLNDAFQQTVNFVK